jgi:polysaccharide biosynthesis protein PslH
MKILLLCDRYPFPLQNGQNLRIYHYVRALQRQHSFTLVCYHNQVSIPEEIQALFKSIQSFSRPPKGVSESSSLFDWIFSLDNLCSSSPEVSSFLASHLRTTTYDLVWVSGWDMIVNLPEVLQIPLLMDAVDDGVLENWREVKKRRSILEIIRALRWLWLNYKFEKKYFEPADQCLFVSEVDAQSFRRVCPKTPAAVIPNGVDIEFFRSAGISKLPGNIVFEGNLSFPPNRDGVLYFCKEMLPSIRDQEPSTRLTLVGKDPPPDICDLRSQFIEVTGYVDDVRSYLDRASVFVCPLRIGAGIKNKILQAWAMGLPVVATNRCTGGLSCEDEFNILIRNRPSEFASAVVELLKNPARALHLGAAGRRTVESSFAWTQRASELETLMRTTVRSKQGNII